MKNQKELIEENKRLKEQLSLNEKKLIEKENNLNQREQKLLEKEHKLLLKHEEKLKHEQEKAIILSLTISYSKDNKKITVMNTTQPRDLGKMMDDNYVVWVRPTLRFFSFIFTTLLTFAIYPVVVGLSSQGKFQKFVLQYPLKKGWKFSTQQDEKNYNTIFKGKLEE